MTTQIPDVVVQSLSIASSHEDGVLSISQARHGHPVIITNGNALNGRYHTSTRTVNDPVTLAAIERRVQAIVDLTHPSPLGDVVEDAAG